MAETSPRFSWSYGLPGAPGSGGSATPNRRLIARAPHARRRGSIPSGEDWAPIWSSSRSALILPRSRTRPKRFVQIGPSIYTDRQMASPLVEESRKRVLLVLFIPSADREGKALHGQSHWVNQALSVLGALFGGATAYPKAQGVWRDDDRGGALVFDEPVVMHCYTTPADIEDQTKLGELGNFCRRMGRETNQGEVGLVIGDEYIAIRNLNEE